MKLIQATEAHASLVGEIHSLAWQQAYEGLFPAEYIDTENSEKRKQEFIESFSNKDIFYYVIYEEVIPVGIVKIVVEEADAYEIASFYMLEKSRTPWAYYMTWSKEFCIGEKYNSTENLKRIYGSEYAITAK